MFLDLDKFKPVNDELGHDVGDLLLKEVATRLQNCVKRESDTVSRLGGDEFVILLPLIEEEHDAAVVAEKALQALSQPFEIEQHTINISCSIGIAVYPEHGKDAHALMINADNAMYKAKQAGRSCFSFFNT
jgi:diguanylate cyclase (GGDEF)-like protein